MVASGKPKFYRFMRCTNHTRLLGMRAIGPEASAIIGPAQLVISSVCEQRKPL